MFSEEFHDQFYNEISVLDAERLVAWKKENQKYNFETLPNTVVLIHHIGFVDRKTKFFSKRVKGIAGKNYIIKNRLLLCSDFGNGAPAIIGLMEELRALGVINFVLLGFGGILSHSIKEGQLCFLNEVYSRVGCSSFYDAKDYLKFSHNKFSEDIFLKLKAKKVIGLSTDAPFRETESFLNEFLNKKVDVIDMECSAIYAFSKFYNLNAICFIVAADKILESKWYPPSNWNQINKSFKLNLKLLLEELS